MMPMEGCPIKGLVADSRIAWSYPQLLVTVVTLLGALLVTYAMRWGPWAYSDSVTYVETGRNFAAGIGLVEIRPTGAVVAYDKQPPLYPVLLGLAHMAGADILAAARWLNIAFFAALLMCLGMVVLRYARSRWLAFPLLVFVGTAPPILQAYTGVMSEAAFLTLGCTGLALLAAYLQGRGRILLWVSGIALALASLTRYAGATFIVAGGLAMVLLQRTSPRRRWTSAAVFCLASGLPTVAWVGSRMLATGLQGGFHAPADNLWAALAEFRVATVGILWEWLPFTEHWPEAPYRARWIVLAILALGTIVLLTLALWRRRGGGGSSGLHDPDVGFALTFTLAAVAHIGFMAAVSVMGPWEVRIDERQLTPILLFGGTGALLALGAAGVVPRLSRLAAGAQLVISLLLVGNNVGEARDFVVEMHENGRGYTSAVWQEPAIWVAVRGIPDGVAIISNDMEAIVFHIGRAAYRLPELQTGEPVPVDERFGSREDDPVHRLFAREGAALVMFNASNWRLTRLYGEETGSRIGGLTQDLYVDFQCPEGAIYFARRPPP
jgi:hypothetical protein